MENQYVRAVERDGNGAARAVVDEIFEVGDRAWRGIGTLARSGLRLRERYARYDASLLSPSDGPPARESDVCIAGEILRGLAKPASCPAYADACTPDHPLGAPRVSSEGACAAYFLAGRTKEATSA